MNDTPAHIIDPAATDVGSTHDITVRKEAEIALRESEERFRQFAENSADVFWIMDAKTRRVEYLNTAHEQIWGEARELLQADSSRAEHLVHPDDRERVRKSLPHMLSGERQTVEYRIIRPVDQAVRWIRDTGFPIRNVEGRIVRLAGLAQDITQDKERSAALSASEERYRVALQGAEMAAWDYDVRARRVVWNEQHFRLFGVEPDGEEKTPEEFLSFVLPADLPMVSERLRVAEEETGTYRAEFRIVRRDTGEVRWMSGFGRAITWEKGKVSRMTGVMFEITERKRIEETLRASEGRMRTLADSVPPIIWTNDASGQASYFNKRWFEYTGLSEEESIRAGWEGIVHPDEAASARERWQHALEAGKIFDIEYRLRDAAGKYRWFIGRNVPVEDADGRVTGWYGSATDIHDLKVAEAARRESDERYRAMFEQANVGIVQTDRDGRFLAVNPGFCAIIGYSEKELRSMRVQDVTDPDDWEKERKRADQLARGEISEFTLEKRYRRKDGCLVWGSMTATVVREESGRAGYTLAIVQPITERKLAEERLRSSEERYRLLVNGARDYAIFMMDPSNEIVYWSSGAERIFGWSAAEALGQSGKIIFTPEDRAIKREEKEIAIALKEGAASDRRWHIRKDGTRFWVDGVMQRLDDEKTGALRGFAKVARDATEQRQAEDALRRGRDELELRVQDRTKELQAMNETLENEMMYRQKLERDILEVTERERARISQDLHDSLCQELTATAFLLKSKARKLGREAPEAGEALSEGAQVVNRNAGLARDLARGLHPLELGSGGLVSALRELASRTSETVTCRCECPRSLRLPVEAVAVNLYRIAQEAVTNALKHAKASEIVIRIEREKGDVTLSISDNGKGIRGVRGRKGLGLNIMRYRANVAGGDLTVEPRRGGGTRIVCVAPVKP